MLLKNPYLVTLDSWLLRVFTDGAGQCEGSYVLPASGGVSLAV